MKPLVATALLLCSDGNRLEEDSSLMQGLLTRHGQLAISEAQNSTKDARKDAATRLMETATNMMKNGVTPDVVTFIETTITELQQNVLGAIVEEHHRDQQLIDNLLARFDDAIGEMTACSASVVQEHNDRLASSLAHRTCRSGEALACARSRKCEAELEQLWSQVKVAESEMVRIHNAIHGEWCVGPVPPHPGLDDPFHWVPTQHTEGPETSESTIPYPNSFLSDGVTEFRTFSVNFFGQYMVQKPIVEGAWGSYNLKLLECARLEESLEATVEQCDEQQDQVHGQACAHASSSRACASRYGASYGLTLDSYNQAVETVRELEYDRKREWETLHIVTCLLETVYTRVIHSIDSGEPCPTEESHPEQTANEINECHVVSESLTANLTIVYGVPPDPPDLPALMAPPCTSQYLWDEHGEFPSEVQTNYNQAISDESLQSFFTTLSSAGWAGCAAPKACMPCETTERLIDPAYSDSSACTGPQHFLRPGQMDLGSFKCVTGDECIRDGGRCNGVANCGDGSDERNCDTPWGIPAVLHSEQCKDPFVTDVQFRCSNGDCISIEGKCNGVNNCADGSDESGCASSFATQVTLEATTGFSATIETPTASSLVFYDRAYTFDSLGSFEGGYQYVKMSNDDKHIRNTHVQTKLRLPQPTTVYVVKLDNYGLPWLEEDGWTLTSLLGVQYHGIRQTRHTEWSGELEEDHYGPGVVWKKTFTAGVVEMRGNNGGDGSYLIFLAVPSHSPVESGHDSRLTSYVDSGSCGPRGNDHNWGWCGSSAASARDCPQTVQTDVCDSGTAQLAHYHGTGADSSYVDSNNCRYNYFAQYRCSEEGDLRLADTHGTVNRGRVEILHEGQWGTVCDDLFDNTDATIVCRQLGFPEGRHLQIQNYGGGAGGSATIHMDNLGCTGSEERLDECAHNGWNSHNCGHYEDAGVECTAHDRAESGSWTTVQGGATSPFAGVNMGAHAFNEMFARCPVVRYTNPSMTGSPAIYKRHRGDYPGDAHRLFTYLWAQQDNQFHSDFDIYPSLEDARAGTNPWQYCNFADQPNPNHNTVGFPRDCGPQVYQPHIWFHATRASGSQSQGYFEIYTGANCPTQPDVQEWCAEQCHAQNYCCNDPSIGSNQMISCAQACMMRASGQSTESMLSANGGICDRRGNSGCSLSVNGQGYSFCQRCSDLQPHCPHGVQSSDECDFGASLAPPSLR